MLLFATGVAVAFPLQVRVFGYAITPLLKLCWLFALFRLILHPKLHMDWLLTLVFLEVFISFAWNMLSSASGQLKMCIGLSRWILDFSFFFLGSSLIRSPRDVQALFKGIALSLEIAMFYVLGVIVILGYYSPSTWMTLATTYGKVDLERWIGGWPNYFGVFFLALWYVGKDYGVRRKGLMFIVYYILMLLVVLFTFSRSVMALFVILLVITPFVEMNSKSIVALTLGIVLVFSAYYYVEPFRYRIFEKTFGQMSRQHIVFDASFKSRLDRFAQGWQYIKKRPLLGYGQRSINDIMPYYYDSYMRDYYATSSAHGDFLDMLFRSGLVGTILFFSMVVYISIDFIRLARRMREQPIRGTLIRFGSACLCLLVLGLTHEMYRYEPWISFFFLMYGAKSNLWRYTKLGSIFHIVWSRT